MALTEIAIRNAKPTAKQYKMGDAGGLFLLVTPSGGKLWRLKFRVAAKEKLLALGAWPDVSLGNARKERDKAKEVLAAGRDPAREKQQAKHRAKVSAANTFGEVAREFLDKRAREGMAVSTVEKSKYYLTRMGPVIVQMPISEIGAMDVLAAVRRIEAKGTYETARRVLQLAGRVFRYAVATARVDSDPTRDLRGALTAHKPKPYAAIIDAKSAGELLRAIDGYEGQIQTRVAMQLSPHVFVRPGELRHVEWSEIDLEAAVWTIPKTKAKMKRQHQVPLSTQSIGLLKKLYAITGPTGYVFPSIRTRTRPMSENTINAGLRRLGFSGDEMTGHGFRAMASTLLNEAHRWHPDAIERALAHRETDKVRAAYDRGQHWQERVEMAQWWSDYLDQLRNDAKKAGMPVM
jgi:integrase